MAEAALKDWERVATRTKGLPTLPATLLRVVEAANDPRCSADEIGQALAKDPALAGKVLSLVNSAYTGLASKVASLRHAAALLGASRIRSLAFSATVNMLLPPARGLSAFDRAGFWRHCLGSALIARALAQRSGVADPEEAYMAGLLHDVGKLLFDLQEHTAFLEAVNTARRLRRPLWEAERALLGEDHAHVGALLLAHWGLPEGLVAACRRHHNHNAALACPPLLALASAANRLCATHGYGDSADPLPPPLVAGARSALGLNPDRDEATTQQLTFVLQTADEMVRVIAA